MSSEPTHPVGDESPLIAYPIQTTFNRVVPKNKIYLHARPRRKLQQRFAAEIAQITWKHKLAPETIKLPARRSVPEIQVFIVALKGPAAETASEDILRCIDRAIGFPIIFELHAGKRVQVVAAYKRPSEADAAKWVVGDYFTSVWFPDHSERVKLPVATDLASLYSQILQRLMPYPARDGESLKDHAERVSKIKSLQRELGKMETQLSREKQFNRKVETNSQKRSIQDQLDGLINDDFESRVQQHDEQIEQ